MTRMYHECLAKSTVLPIQDSGEMNPAIRAETLHHRRVHCWNLVNPYCPFVGFDERIARYAFIKGYKIEANICLVSPAFNKPTQQRVD